MSCTLAALTTLSVCTLLTFLSLNQIQVCSAVAIGESCNDTLLCDAASNATCTLNVCVCANDTSNHSEICRKSSYGESCNSSVYCDVNLTCHANLSKCICDVNSQFWFNECLPLQEIAVSNITASVETNKITLNWNVTEKYSSNVTYAIKTDFGKSESVTSTGGVVSGLKSGSKYNFTVVSTPPTDTFVHYTDYSVASEPFWTYAVYGNVCQSEPKFPHCVSDLVCRPPNTSATNLCLCNTSQFWSLGCVDIQEIAVSNITASVETNKITLNWNVTEKYSSNVTYTIKTDFGTSESVTSNGGIISGLQSGSKYNFTVVSTPPKDTFVHYTDYSVPTKPFWTYAVYGNVCQLEESYPVCVSGYVCRTPNTSATKLCLCSTSQFWSSGCVDSERLAVSILNDSVIRDTSSITLKWNANYTSNVAYSIKTSSGTVSSVNFQGGSISGLTPGNKYNFTVVSTPPKDAFTTYKAWEVQTGDFWTYAVYGNVCQSENISPECAYNLNCTLPSSNPSKKLCLCNDTQFRSQNSLCVELAVIQVSGVQSTVTKDAINLTWTVNSAFSNSVTFQIQYGTVYINATSNGGSISGLNPGTNYNFNVISIPPHDNYTTYKNTSVTTDIWTNALYGQSCTDNHVQPCDTGLTCRLDKSNATYKCLCNSSQYWSSVCQASNGLKVLNPTIISVTTDTISLSWTVAATNLTGVKFNTNYSSVNLSANETGGIISGLIPGTKYSFIITSIPPENSDFTYSPVSVTIGVIWTNPSQPGNINQVKQINNSDMYEISFGASLGNIAQYKLSVKNKTNVEIYNNVSTTNTFIISGLIPGQSYSYTLHAINGNGTLSVPTEDIFSTNATKSGPVSKDTLKDLRSTSVSIAWESPESPNGKINGYIVEVFSNETCVYSYKIKCTDCAYTDPGSHCPNVTELSRNSTDLKNIDILITNLRPYRNYTYNVSAINEAGIGSPISNNFTTMEAAPYNLESVNAKAFRINENKAGMNITITPGEYTGPTYFNVCMNAPEVERTCEENYDDTDVNYHSHSYIKNKPLIVTIPDLLAFWNYTIEVNAFTTAGKSNWTVINEQTPTNVPGEAQFSVTQDLSTATNLTMHIRCPDKKFRNGIITNFTVNIENGNKSFNQTIQASRGCEKNYTEELREIIVEQNYSFRVIVFNTDFSSPFSKPLFFYVEPKAPNITEIVIKLQGSGLSTSQAKVILSLKTLLNAAQGKLTDISLVICADVPGSKCKSEKRRKRQADMVEKFNHTWLESSKLGFTLGYRASPKDWLKKLQELKLDEYTYTIGEETCGSTESFCNGPLPSNTKFSVIIIVCTRGGCGDTSPLNLETKAEENNTPAIVGGVVGGILGLALIIAVVFLIIYFKRRPHSARPSSSSYVDLIKRDEHIKEHRPVRITEFKDHVKKLHKDSNLLFQDEFEDIKKLSSRLPNICDEAKKENNRVKNRYVDILPYDSSRVKLEVQPEDDETMDFINANYIPGYNSVREYIATQGPMHSTVPDFWRMVWEQKCRVIVMLSDLTEQGKPKVTLYWPENLGEPINYGNVIVEMTNFSQLNKYIIRNFKIAKGSETRKVTHFFLPGWWDFSANLTTGDVLEFAQLVRQEATPANSGPIVVHCSAGVGRTGTFIALDYFMQYIEKHSLLDSVDVFSYVMKMRAARPRMVQAETQYIFIFDALDEVIDRKIKIEQEKNEHLYSNGGGNDLYANIGKAPEESIYANTQVINEKNGIDNKAFESDYENLTLNKTNQPTTVL